MLARRRALPEDRTQAALVRWARATPGLEDLVHVPNGGERHPVVGGQMVALGARRGFPDLHLPVPTARYHGLYLELKATDGTLRPEQDAWLRRLASRGYAAVVAYGLEAAQAALLAYLAGERVAGVYAPLPDPDPAPTGPRRAA